MDKCLKELQSTGIFVCFCVSMELDCLDLMCIDVRVSKMRWHIDIEISFLHFCVTDLDLYEMRMYWIGILLSMFV